MSTRPRAYLKNGYDLFAIRNANVPALSKYSSKAGFGQIGVLTFWRPLLRISIFEISCNKNCGKQPELPGSW